MLHITFNTSIFFYLNSHFESKMATANTRLNRALPLVISPHRTGKSEQISFRQCENWIL